MQMQDFKNMPAQVFFSDSFDHALERAEIMVRRVTVKGLRLFGVKSAAYRRAEIRRSIRRDYVTKIMQYQFQQGRNGDGRAS